MELFKLEAVFPSELAKFRKLNLLPAGYKDWGAVKTSSVYTAPKVASKRFRTRAYQKQDFYKLISRMI
ncbi:MAG: hypothetical protein JNM21_14310 [Taibaiella sp.]|nr:hypothetical protein [Taibaiella sp.]